MAEAVAPGKIAFLVNTAPLRDRDRCQEYYRQLCMATIRLLLFLCSFPRRKTTAKLRWSYRMYDSEKPCPTATVGLRTESFLEFNSATLETYFSELKAHMCIHQNTTTSINTDQAVHSRVLASALGALVLELPWDKPELHSPARYSRIAAGTSRKSQQRSKPTDLSSTRDNLVFVVSDCPQSGEDLAAFSSRSVHHPSAHLKGRGTGTKGAFISDDLSSQLKKCNIALHWVDTAPAHGKTKLDYAGLDVFSKILQSEEGGVLPVSSLILPLEGQTFPPEPLKGQSLPSANTEGQSLSFRQLRKSRRIATVAMESNAHQKSLVNSDVKQTRGPVVSHAVPPSIWLRSRLQPRLNTQVRRKRGEMSERRIELPLFNPDGVPICFLKGSSLSPLNPKGAQSRTKLTMSLRSSSSKDQARVKQTQLAQAAQDNISPEIPVQSSTTTPHLTDGRITSELPAPSVAVVLAVLPHHEVPLSWLHQTEVYVCGGYCYRQPKGDVEGNSGRETTASGGTPGVVVQECARQVKVVTDTVWCAASEEEEEHESGTTQEAHTASREAVATNNTPSDNVALPGDGTLRAAYSTPLRELAVVVEKSPISQDALPKEPSLASRLLSFQSNCPGTSPFPCPGQGTPAEETLQSGRDSPGPLPSLILSPVASCMAPLSYGNGDPVLSKPSDRGCEGNSTVKGEGRELRLLPTSVNSRTFQGLCLLLSKRQLVAVLSVGGTDVHQRVNYAILQPITSLRAALTHIRPTKTTKLQEVLRRARRPPHSDGAPAGLGCHGDVGGGVVSLAATELEIHANLSLLFPRQSQPTGLTEDLLQQHVDAVLSSSQSHGVAYCLLPWFPLHPQHGISKTLLQHTKDSHSLSQLTPSSLSHSRSLAALKRAYSCGVKGTDTLLPTPVGDTDGQTDSNVAEQSEPGRTSPSQLMTEVVDKESLQPPQVEPSVVCTDTDTVQCVCECSSVEEVVARFREVYSQLLSDKSEPGTLQRALHKHFCWLQCQLDGLRATLSSFLTEHVLQTCTTLKGKHTLSGSPDTVATDPLLARELFLQIMLYLEAVSADATQGLDSTLQIVSMCIASLPFTEVIPMGKLFQEVVVPSYGDSCRTVLTDVYDELMWPLPPSLGGDDTGNSFLIAKTPVAAEEMQGTELSHDSHMTNMSPLEEYGAPRAPASTGSVKSAPLARQHSFHHGAVAKEIALVTGKGRSKRKSKNRKAKPGSSPRIASSTVSVKTSENDRKSNVNKVKRSLFTRSYSTSEATSLREGANSTTTSPDSKARKRTRSDENDVFSTPKRRRYQRNTTIAWDISCVKETPLKKQVANPLKLKLQRARSKVAVSPDVLFVAETPKRSRLFYTQLPSQGRKQGPLAEGDQVVKKDPSPESLKALLHGRLAHRGRRGVQQSQSTDPQVEQLITDIIDESPSKNSSLDQSLSEDPLVVIACTPLRSSRPKQALLLDTPLKVGAVMGSPGDIGCISDAAARHTSGVGGVDSKDGAFSTGSVNMVGQECAPQAGFTTPVRQPPALGTWSAALQRTTDSPDLFAHSPCSGPGIFTDTPTTTTTTTCTDSHTPIIPDRNWASPEPTHFRSEVPDVSMETDSHIAYMMSTPPRNRYTVPTSFHGIFPKAE